MHIAIFSIGSRGDCQPYFVMANHFVEQGHHVVFVTHENHRAIASRLVVDNLLFHFVGLDSDIETYLHSGDFAKLICSDDPVTMMNSVNALVEANWMDDAKRTYRACKEYKCDVALANLSTWTYAMSVTESLEIPLVLAPLIPPAFETSMFPPVFMASRPLPFMFGLEKLLTRVMYHVLYAVLTYTTKNGANFQIFRESLGNVDDLHCDKSVRSLLFRTMFVPWLLCYSPTLSPTPRMALNSSDWDKYDYQTVGFITMDHSNATEDHRLSTLNCFPVALNTDKSALARGEGMPLGDWVSQQSCGPVFVSFGSMVMTTGKRVELLTTILKAAIELKTVPMIIQSGWAGLTVGDLCTSELVQAIDGIEAILPHIVEVDSIPHHAVFPHCSLVIHHGGSGTTGAVMRAGVPQLVFPFGFDQPYFAWRVFDMGVSPGYIQSFRKVTTPWLVKMVRDAVTSETLQQNAKQLKETSGQNDGGVEVILEKLEAVVAQGSGKAFWENSRRKHWAFMAEGRRSSMRMAAAGVALVAAAVWWLRR